MLRTTKPTLLILFVTVIISTACGGGGSNGNATPQTVTTNQTSFSLSGTISSVSGSVVDIDVNDTSRQNRNNPNTDFQSNNSSIEAQPLPNPAILNGFVSATGTGAPSSGSSNFAFDGDTDDYYSVLLLEGQFVSLRMSDFDSNNPTANDIDVELYNDKLELIATSDSNTEFESIAVASQGNYFIRVRAISGVSKYVLNIGTTSFLTGLQAYGKSADFIDGEAVIKMQPASQLSIQSANTALATMALSHQDNSRTALTRFDIADLPTINASVNSLSKNTIAINAKNHSKLETLKHIKELNNRADVEYAEPNYRVYANLTPNDNFYFLQAHYPQISLPQAWDITTGTPSQGSVVVAVVDTGVVFSHPDLAGQFVNANDDYDFIQDTNTSADGNGIDPNPDDPGDEVDDKPSTWHGTHVAGTIAAASNNNLGVAGVSWGAKIMPVRVLGRNGGTSYDIEQGVRFAAGLSNDSGTIPSKRADIINMSLGGTGYSQSAQVLLNQVRNAGIIVIASAGNEQTSMPSYPAAYENVISVSAVDLVNNLAPYSNFGAQIDVAAPGGDVSIDRNGDGYGDGVLSAFIDNSDGNRNPSYAFYQGTSMAAPHVAGVAALMKAIYPALTPSDFEASLQNGLLTDDLGSTGRDNLYGFGLINALKAVQHAQLIAGGAATGSILASPTHIDFSSTLTARTLTLSQIGSSPPDIVDAASTAQWLTINDTTASGDETSSVYTLTVNREGLPDATYTDNVIFTLSDGNTLTVTAAMQVQNNASVNADSGFLFVLLLNADTSDVVAQTGVDTDDGTYQFNFTDVPAGDYRIMAGSDIDNDLTICSLGESCGRYPTNEQTVRITVDKDIDNLNFLASIMSDVNSPSQAGSDNTVGIARISAEKNSEEQQRLKRPAP